MSAIEEGVAEGGGGEEAEKVSQDAVVAEVLVTLVGFVIDALLIVAALLGFQGFDNGDEDVAELASFLPLMITLAQLHFLLAARPFTFADGKDYAICIRPVTLECGRGCMLQMNCRFAELRRLREGIETQWVEWCFANIALLQLIELLALGSLLGSLLGTGSSNILLIIVVGLDFVLNLVKAVRFFWTSNSRQVCNNLDPSIMIQLFVAPLLSPMLLVFLIQILLNATVDWKEVRKSVCFQSPDNVLRIAT